MSYHASSTDLARGCTVRELFLTDDQFFTLFYLGY